MAGGTIENTGGVRPMNVGGRVASERERLTGMNAEERAWRKKYLDDQVIREKPRYVEASRKLLLNPFRRMYRAPLDFVFTKFVGPFTGQPQAEVLRFYTGRALIGVWGGFAIFYYFKYQNNTWQSNSSWRVIKSKKSVLPGDPGYPAVSPPKDPHEYYDRGFKDSVFAKEFFSTRKSEVNALRLFIEVAGAWCRHAREAAQLKQDPRSTQITLKKYFVVNYQK